jgi:hypothetical protein
LLTGALLDGSDLLRAYVHGARAGNTYRVYDAQWQQFATWCGRQGVSALPADPRFVAEYLAVRAQAGVAVASINVMLSAVCFMHKTSGLSFARTDPILMLAIDGIRRQHVGNSFGLRPRRRPSKNTPSHRFDSTEPRTWCRRYT